MTTSVTSRRSPARRSDGRRRSFAATPGSSRGRATACVEQRRASGFDLFDGRLGAGGGELGVGIERRDDASCDLLRGAAPTSPCELLPVLLRSAAGRGATSRAAMAEISSASRMPKRRRCLSSFSSGTVGLRSSGTVSTRSDSVTPTASTITKRVLRVASGVTLGRSLVDHAHAAALHLLEVRRGLRPSA